MNSEKIISDKYNKLKSLLNEKSRRIWAATEAKSIGRGGPAMVSRAIGMSVATIHKGVKELALDGNESDGDKSRSSGGGRKSLLENIEFKTALENLIEDTTRGDPESPLLWTCKSTYLLRDELMRQGFNVSQRSICTYLEKMGYSLQANKKTEEGGDHPDRDEQFKFIYSKTKEFLDSCNPVISVDTKKKENIGNYKNNGKEYYKKGNAPDVKVYDFIDKEKGKVSPYGIYDISKNNGWVSVGISADTGEFAVNSIRSWWKEMGRKTYKDSEKIFINCDGGGSNGSRNRLWKVELQKLSNNLGMSIHVSHFPPGTSKWNKIEHRMFSFITKNWRGRPLLDRATVVNLISSTTTRTGLTISARLDENEYEKGIKISDAELNELNLLKNEFHGEWNYQINPKI
jgi:transposase